MKFIPYFIITTFSLLGCTTTPQTNETINVGSFNILGIPKDGEGPRERAEIGREVVRFHDWDIFGTQEMRDWQKEAYLSDDNIYGTLGRDCCTKKEDPKSWEQWGNYIFYKKDRFSVLDSGYFWLSQTPEKPSRGWNERQYRICNWGKFADKKTGKQFYFFNLHQGLRKEARLESAKLINSKIKSIADENSALFITGDFNATNDQPSIAEIQKNKIVVDSWAKSETSPYGSKGSCMRANLNKPVCDQIGKTNDRRIDYIFVSRNVDVLKCATLTDNREGRYPSDHLPVMCVVRIK